MDDVFVGNLMSSPVHTVGIDTSVRDAGETMLEHDIGSVIVVDDTNRLEGILTATDFIRVVAEGTREPNSTVAVSMSTNVITTTANESIRTVADVMVEHGFHHVPVVNETDGVIGIVTTTDLTMYLSNKPDLSPSSSTS